MPATDDPEALEAARKYFSGEIEFVLGVVAMEGLPDGDRAEIAFAGRSNVGKSSLLNALTNRKNLARTSNTPGRTQEINYFLLAQQLYIVDLPGYGYAKVSKTQSADWTDLVFAYLRGRPNLRRVMLLIDGRHGIKENDKEVMDMLDTAAVSYQIVLTKCDKPKSADFQKVLEKTLETIRTHVAAHPRLLVTSSVKGDGIEDVRAEMWGVATGNVLEAAS